MTHTYEQVSSEKLEETNVSSYDVIGKPIPKKDAQSLLEGKPLYTDDIVSDDALIVKFLRSPHAHAEIASIDTSRAEKVTGIHAIYTYKDVPQVRFTLAGQTYPEPSPYDRLILDKKLRYVGDEVAMVVGETEEICDRAIKLIDVEYTVLPAVLDFTQAIDNPSVVHDEDNFHLNCDIGADRKRNICASQESSVGDLESAFAQSDVIIEHSYHTKQNEQSMMETFRSYAYPDEQGRICVVCSTQVPFHIRRMVSNALQIPQSQVRVVKPRIGGGFGAKQSGCNEIFAAFAAYKLGRPCKSIYSRKETFVAGNSRHEMLIKVKIGAKKDGTMLAMDIDTLSNAGAYGEHAPTTVGLVGHKTLPMYNHLKASRFSATVVYTNTKQAGAFRGYGATQGIYAVESAVNELADKLKIDPYELRMKNVVQTGEVMPQYYGETLTSGSLVKCLEKVREMTDWSGDTLVQDLGDRVRGRGIAMAMQGSGISDVDIAGADIRLEQSGFYTLSVGVTDNGTGADTIMAQMAAEVLHCSVDNIVVHGVDTDVSPYDPGAYASSGTYVSGMAAKRAAQTLLEHMYDSVSQLWDVPCNTIAFDGDRFETHDGAHAISLRELADKSCCDPHMAQLFSARGTAGELVSPPPLMAAVAEVEIDKTTGEVSVVDYAAAIDCGTVINTNLARVQAEGGIGQGIGMALFEDVQRSNSGRMRTHDFMTYKIPTRMDLSAMRIAFVDSYEKTGPYGAKSIGEIVIDTPAPAIASAVAHATGAYIRSLPITPEKVLLSDDDTLCS